MAFDLLQVGDRAPSFSLMNYNGEEVSLSDFKGKNVILWFFPKASTPGWTVEGSGFRDEFKDFESSGYEIIGISADPPKRQKKFVEKYDFPFYMLCDESKEILESYKVWALKKFMGKEYMGILRATYIIGPDGKISKVYDQVKTKTHAQDILSDIAKIWFLHHSFFFLFQYLLNA